MSDYSITTDFSVKDALVTGNPLKLIKGSDVDTEFDSISTAVATKANKVSAPTSGNLATLNGSGDLVDSTYAPTNIWRRNVIINGGMAIAQRGTSFAAIADAAYSLDRWKYGKVGTMVHTITQSTTVPTAAQAGRVFSHSMKLELTTADTAIAAGDFCVITQQVEGYNFQPIAQQAFVVSFWIRHGTTGTYCVSCRNSGLDRSYIGTFTIAVANTWEQKTVTVLASPSAGTWDYTTGVGLSVSICLAAGSTFQTTAAAWQTGNFFATSAQTNGVNTSAGDLYLTGVQVEIGTAKTPFEATTVEQDLARCQRYSEWVAGVVLSAGVFHAYYFKVTKRATPTVGTIVFNTGTGATLAADLPHVALNSNPIGSAGLRQLDNHSANALFYVSVDAEL